MCNEKINVTIEPVILIGEKTNLYIDQRFETIEAANERFLQIQNEGEEDTVRLEIIQGFELIANHEGRHFEDAKPFYLSKEEAIQHYNEVVYKSHIVEAVDTEGHTYECYLCDYHYYVLDPLFEEKPCPAERNLILS